MEEPTHPFYCPREYKKNSILFLEFTTMSSILYINHSDIKKKKYVFYKKEMDVKKY